MNFYKNTLGKVPDIVGTNKNYVLCILLIILCLLFAYTYFRKTSVKEGLNVGKEINKAISSIENVGREVQRIPGAINGVKNDMKKIPKEVENGVKKPAQAVERKVKNVSTKVTKTAKNIEKTAKNLEKKMTRELDKFFKKVTIEVENIVTKKIVRFFKRFADEFKKAFVDPMGKLFIGIGSVFEELGRILKKIIDKIVSLPDCVPYYSLSVGGQMSKKFFPGWLNSLIQFWRWLTEAFLTLLSPWLILVGIDYSGWKDQIRRKCFKFETKSNTRAIKRNMTKAGNDFLKKFGRVNWKRVVS